MSESIYDQVTKHLNFFRITYFAMQKAKFECKGEIVEYNPVNRLKIIFDFDYFKKEFSPDHVKYFEDFNTQFGILYEAFNMLFISDEEFEKIKSSVANDLLLNPKPKNPQLMYLLWFKEDLAYIINYLERELKSEEKVLEQLKKSSKVKGQPKLTRNQTSLLFFYLRELLIIGRSTNENMAWAISILTGYAEGQIQDILRAPDTDAYQLGKDNDKVTRSDFKETISTIESLLERIKKDYKKYSDNNELR